MVQLRQLVTMPKSITLVCLTGMVQRRRVPACRMISSIDCLVKVRSLPSIITLAKSDKIVAAADALITNLCIRTHLSLNQERRFVFNLPAHPKEAQQSVTINLPINHWKIQIVPRLNPALEAQQRPYKLFVIVNGQTLGRQIPPPQDPVDPGCQVFDAQLHAGVNTIMIQMIAAVPKGQKLPNGADAELEKITVLANLLKY